MSDHTQPPPLAPGAGPITRRHSMTQPLALRRLVDRFGQGEAAEKLGLSPEAVSRSLRDNSVRTVTEVAAEGLLDRTAEPLRDRVVIARVPTEHREVVRSLLSALQIETWEWE